MDKILYLVHAIPSDYDKTWKELKTSSIDDANDQFPGVYFSLHRPKRKMRQDYLFLYILKLCFR